MNRAQLLQRLLSINSSNEDTQRRGRNVVVIATALMLASLCTVGVVWPRPDGAITGSVSIVMALIYALVTLLARRGRVTVAGYVLTIATMIVIVINALATQQLRVAPYTFSICVLLAGMMLPPVGVVLTLLLSCTILGGFYVALGNVPQIPMPLSEMLLLVGVLTFVTAIISGLGARGFERTLANAELARQSVEESEAKQRRLAWSDPLTGLANRRLLQEHLQKLVLLPPATAAGYAVLLLDLDRFKTINDSLGHIIGDQLLQAVAQRLQTVVRPQDTVARLGGDEFAVMLTEITSAEAALAITERMHACFRTPFILDGYEVVTSTSIGIVLWTPAYRAPEELLRDADSALYRAKALGRARSALFDTAMHLAALAELQLEADLRHAVARNEFSLQYQPIVAFGTGRVLRVEALLRWNHPTRGPVSPAEFIPLAEETGLIVPLGAWALRAACLQLQALHREGWTDLGLAVNLSPRQFRQEGLISLIRDVLRETGIPAACLEVELTETSLMEDVDSVMLQLQAMSDLGLDIAVDDFGTGYSSLAYLKRFPIDTLKIDRAFVTDCAHDRHDAAIVTATIALARSLNLSTVAEGVETPEQMAFLHSGGCTAVQGYHISRPLTPDALVQYLRRTHSDARATAFPQVLGVGEARTWTVTSA